MFLLRKLRQVTVIGLGLLGSSITLVVSKGISGLKAVGYSHRQSTRERARDLEVADVVFDDILSSVSDADIVILATPICTFEQIFKQISPGLPDGCIVTDVGSTKVLAHRWARKCLGQNVHYVGSHPIAGSEQRGVDFARDDLFYDAMCLVTAENQTDAAAVKEVESFWTRLGCRVSVMSPSQHDKILGNVSHVPHAAAAALVNASSESDLKFSGTGFVDTSRVASGPANVWADIFYTNSVNVCRGLDRTVSELIKLRDAIKGRDKQNIERLLEKARSKRARLIDYKMKKKEIT